MNEWIKSIVAFMLFVPFVLHIIPNESYRKYISYYLALLLILILLEPISKVLNIEDFMQSSWKTYTQQLEKELERQETADSLTTWTNEQIDNYIKTTAKNYGLQVTSTNVTIDTKVNSNTYGQVLHLTIKVVSISDEIKVEQLKKSLSRTFLTEVEDIEIGV